jgi:hypothetical protein
MSAVNGASELAELLNAMGLSPGLLLLRTATSVLNQTSTYLNFVRMRFTLSGTDAGHVFPSRVSRLRC